MKVTVAVLPVKSQVQHGKGQFLLMLGLDQAGTKSYYEQGCLDG